MDALFLKHDDVDMALDPEIYRKISPLPGYVEADDIMIHYTVTQQCPFNCRGCINPLTAGMEGGDRRAFAPEGGDDQNLQRDIKGIARLIRDSGKGGAVIVYYGGEPMLRLEKMNELYECLGKMRAVSGLIRYMVVTSGHYLQRAIQRYPDLASNMWLTALSVDGTQEQHEAMRRGTSLTTIRRQLADFSQVRRGDVLIWSTMRPGMSLLDCFSSFITFRERAEAEHFFWHWDEAEGVIEDLKGYIEDYRRDLDEVMGIYVDYLRCGELISIVHVNELILYLLTQKRRGTTACAVEKMANFDILGDGKVHACADLPEAMSIGHIEESGEIVFKPDAKERIGKLVAYKTDLGCGDCGVEPYCGGRCPVQAHTGGIERARQYCYMMREHVRTVKKYIGQIADLMLEQGITLGDLYGSARYTKYTDVTP
jgi:radical SAM protein with 4Fe4S-binding SPASM domain